MWSSNDILFDGSLAVYAVAAHAGTGNFAACVCPDAMLLLLLLCWYYMHEQLASSKIFASSNIVIGQNEVTEECLSPPSCTVENLRCKKHRAPCGVLLVSKDSF